MSENSGSCKPRVSIPSISMIRSPGLSHPVDEQSNKKTKFVCVDENARIFHESCLSAKEHGKGWHIRWPSQEDGNCGGECERDVEGNEAQWRYNSLRDEMSKRWVERRR